jgi:hypothetical protein
MIVGIEALEDFQINAPSRIVTPAVVFVRIAGFNFLC